MIAAALSGGVDSLMAAYLLKKAGQQVIGIHFVTGFEAACTGQDFNDCLAAAVSAMGRLSQQLDIPIQVIDIRNDFKKTVVDYFTRTYLAGRTPNPCLVCNPGIKFKTVLEAAKSMGAQVLATGHYARVDGGVSRPYRLRKGLDPAKDQSYFLAFLTQDQLACACFPLGEHRKIKIVALAEKKGLSPVTSQESQDVCFIKNGSYGEFLTRREGFRPRPGAIVDRDGKTIGVHPGLHLFTVGQRRGINCPASRPYYVLRLDAEKNRLVVGFKEELYQSECKVSGLHWMARAPEAPLAVDVRVRYRHQAVSATVIPGPGRTARIRFETPQAALTPGQGAVFYRDDEVLGGAWIEGH